jgi:hypothetical protein
MYYQQYNTKKNVSLQFTNRYTYYVYYQQYSLYRCTLYIMYGYTLIIHDITLLLTTSELTTHSHTMYMSLWYCNHTCHCA